MSEMRERVAVAIMVELAVQALDDAENGIDGDRREVTMAECRMAARAAIEAMREPTEAMVSAGSVTEAVALSEDAVVGFFGAKECWREMIDAALVSERGAEE